MIVSQGKLKRVFAVFKSKLFKWAIMSKSSHRYDFIDFVRGVAIALMLIYHFCYGLAELGVLVKDFNSSLFWFGFRQVIVILFLVLVGISFILTTQKTLIHKTLIIRFCLLENP